jgi:hypothetical protein
MTKLTDYQERLLKGLDGFSYILDHCTPEEWAELAGSIEAWGFEAKYYEMLEKLITKKEK